MEIDIERKATSSKVTRPALRYFGGKFRLSKWILSQLPEHETYVEPFGGAMGVLLNKQPAHFEIYNDLDGEVVNFFRVLRDHPDELIRLITLTPFSRKEQQEAMIEKGGLEDIERARRLYIRSWQSHGGGRSKWKSGWRYQYNNNRGKATISDWNEIDHLWSIVARLKTVQIECDHALKVMKRYDAADVLFYLDPPYMNSTLSNRWELKAYSYGMDDAMHEEILQMVVNMKGMVAISGKRHELYDRYLEGWVCLQKTVPTDFNSMSIENLWLSPNLVAKQHQMRMDL